MKINLSALKKTIQSLERSLSVYDEHENNKNKKLKDSLKESVIQNFEVTYEMSRNMIKRYLKEFTDENIDQMAINDIYRLGVKSGILSDAEDWFDYRDKRNQTSHMYDEEIAKDVFLTGRKFLNEAQFLLKKLEERIEY